MRRWILALFTLGAAACSDSLHLGISSGPSGLVLFNTGSEPIYYFVVERETATLIDWVPCVNPVTCPSIAPGSSVDIPAAQIIGYRAGAREAIVYWWRLKAEGAGYRTDDMRTRVVRITSALQL